jgi:Fe-S cluster assembly protein SufD
MSAGVLAPAGAGYLAEFAAAAAARSAEPERLRELRQQGYAVFAAQGFPTQKEEAWKYTNLAPIAQGRFRRARGASSVAPEAVARFLYPDCAALVFVDGRLAPDLSNVAGLPGAVHTGSLAAALCAGDAAALRHLGAEIPLVEHPLAALNTALFADGAFVHVPDGVVVERPIQLLFVATGDVVEDEPVLSLPRNLIVAGVHSQVRVIESYVALGGAAGGAAWTCGVTEIVAAADALVDHYRVQRESMATQHTALQQVVLGRGARVSSHALSLGAALARYDVLGLLAGEGADANLNCLYLVHGRQHVDTHMRVDHRAAHCSSHELYKGVLDGKARAVFNGLIYVHPGAQKTDAKQTNRNLLLSPEALVNTNPQLRIFADDVKCTHGSTVGQLDAEAIFYLRSRGIGEEAARSLLTYAFALDIVERITFAPLRHELETFLFGWLPKGEVVAQAV